MNHWSRREFLAFLGRTAIVSGGLPFFESFGAKSDFPKALSPTDKDDLVVSNGFRYEILLRTGDILNKSGDAFGFNPDYLAFFGDSKKGGLLWVNHEFPEPLFLSSGFEEGKPRTESQVVAEQKVVGGSLVWVEKKAGTWRAHLPDARNRRLDANTVIPFSWDEPIAGEKQAIGTFANCAGGLTPWGTVLTCEENTQDYYGEVDRKGNTKPSKYGWENFFKRSPLHYGWVVEIEPKTGAARKLVSLGRFAHEGATVRQAKDGRAVVYLGDDSEDQCLYKFISAKKGSLDRGTLYVADMKRGRWITLRREEQESLKKEFKSQTEIQVFTREAAEIVGGTPLHRPEDIAIDPLTGDVIVALTNSPKHKDFFGALLKLQEAKNDPLALEFSTSTFLTGGKGFACPDNLEFDEGGNLWMTVDISGNLMGQGPYKTFANNGLFYIPKDGSRGGLPIQVASAPVGAEFTGPLRIAGENTLLLSVQHPGETPVSGKFSSHWPDGKIPTSAVVAVSWT